MNIKTFKLPVRSKDYDKTLDASLRPENVYVRKFVSNFSNRASNSFNGPKQDLSFSSFK